MIPELRKKFNTEYTSVKYNSFLNEMNNLFKYPVDFRISETPFFLDDDLKRKLIAACDDLCNQISSNDFKLWMKDAVPPHIKVPDETEHPELFVFDFAICRNENSGKYYPKLIELQGFPTLYGYQYFFERYIRQHFNLPEGYTQYFNNITPERYVKLLREVIVADADPANVILLEIAPEKQKTRVDFAATEKLLGINEVCISDVVKRGKVLYYKKDGIEIPIERIYNRVIFDELKRTGLRFNFDLREELNVTWIPHPNWFYKMSKYSLPVLKGEFVPKCFYLKDLTAYPDDLENFVLKPLFSFSGLGVKIDVTQNMLHEIKDPQNYILQEKVEYTPLIETPDERAKVEIRMMFIWPVRRLFHGSYREGESRVERGQQRPILVNNLVRLSKGKMMGVDYNKNKTWVGGSTALHKIQTDQI